MTSSETTGAARSQAIRTSVLVADDDASLRLVVRRTLEREGYRVDEASNGEMALARVLNLEPSVVVLDISMPGMNGLDVLRRLRQGPRPNDVAVILLTSRAEEGDRVVGLELGADDYIVKPFYPRELTARIGNLLRRRGNGVQPERLEVGDLVMDMGSREGSVRGEPVELTAREFDLLAFLMSSPRQVFSRDQLLRQVWGSSHDWQDPSTVTEHIRRIRTKLAAGSPSEWITTVRGVGYKFGPPRPTR